MTGKVALLALIGIWTLSCGKGGDTASQRVQDAGSATPAQPAPALANAQMVAHTPTEQVDLVTLLSEYKGNEVRADGKYKGQRVRVTGKVGKVKKDVLDNAYVTIGTGAQFEIPVVQCYVRGDQLGAASRLNAGQQVTAEGDVDGLMMNVLFRDCAIQVPVGERACAALETPPAVLTKCELAQSGQGYKLTATDGTPAVLIVTPVVEKTKSALERMVSKDPGRACANGELGLLLSFVKTPDEKLRVEVCKRIANL